MSHGIDVSNIEKRLNKVTKDRQETDTILQTIQHTYKAMNYAGKGLETCELYLVFKNTGGYRIFKTLDKYIVQDQLDQSFSESRDLICLSGWNTGKIYRIYSKRGTANKEKTIHMETITRVELHKVLFKVVEPKIIEYVVGGKDFLEKDLVKLTMDSETLRGMTYQEMLECMEDAYCRFYTAQQKGKQPSDKTNPLVYHVVNVRG